MAIFIVIAVNHRLKGVTFMWGGVVVNKHVFRNAGRFFCIAGFNFPIENVHNTFC